MKLKNHSWNKLIAIIALINYGLVLFNLTYLPARSFYGQTLPLVIQLYDPVKAIANRLLNVSIRDVLPQIRPDLEALVHYNLAASFQQLPVYR